LVEQNDEEDMYEEVKFENKSAKKEKDVNKSEKCESKVEISYER